MRCSTEVSAYARLCCLSSALILDNNVLTWPLMYLLLFVWFEEHCQSISPNNYEMLKIFPRTSKVLFVSSASEPGITTETPPKCQGLCVKERDVYIWQPAVSHSWKAEHNKIGWGQTADWTYSHTQNKESKKSKTDYKIKGLFNLTKLMHMCLRAFVDM